MLVSAFRLGRIVRLLKKIGALKVEARKHRFSVHEERRPTIQTVWRHETLTVKGKLQSRYRDLKTGRFIKKPF